MKKAIIIYICAWAFNILYSQSDQQHLALASINTLTTVYTFLKDEESLKKENIPFLIGWLNRFNQEARQCFHLKEQRVEWTHNLSYNQQDSVQFADNVIALIKILSHAGEVNKELLKDQAFRNEAVLERTVNACRKKILPHYADLKMYKQALEFYNLPESTIYESFQPFKHDWLTQSSDTIIIDGNTGKISHGKWEDVKDAFMKK